VKRLLIAAPPLLFLANWIAVVEADLAEPLDVRWLATHCTALPAAERVVLAERVVVDETVIDTDYWYDGPDGAAFLAMRGGLSKSLCLGAVGCLLAVRVEGDCLDR
jgi:hypothetical protein